MSRRLLLFWAIMVGMSAHAAVLLALHRFPLKIHSPGYRNANRIGQTASAFLARQRRTELIAEVFDHLQKAEPELKQQLHELRAEYAPSLEMTLANKTSLELNVELFSFESNLSSTLSEKNTLEPGNRFISPLPLVTTVEAPPLVELEYEDDPYTSFGTLASSEHFDIDVEYAPKRNRPGYVFQVTFHPRSDVVFKRIRQNVFFLIDRSNSISRPRYHLNKRAVSEALDHLKMGDTFNILVFDHHVIRAAPEPLPWNEESVSVARSFLERQGHGGHFAATDLYASLGKIIPHNVSDHEVNTAILLSDGDTYLSREKQRQLIGRWAKRNEGKVALYSLATGTGNNLPLLDLMSSFNQGQLIYSHDHRDLKSLITNLLKTIQTPIGKEMVATPIVADKQTVVLLQPTAVRLQDLYQGRPFVVYGSANRLSDFVLFLQGKYYDRRFDIKKKITFKNALLGSFSIERKWTELLAHEFYARYLEDGNLGHLETAKQLLAPLKISTPWVD